jgi:hypothetical protein
MTAWFIWAKGLTGPEPQLVFTHLPDTWNPQKKNTRALEAHELKPEHHDKAKQLARVASANGEVHIPRIEFYAQQFPKPDWPSYD